MDEGAISRPRTTCRNCGAFVTQAFARVFGDNDDRVTGCPECTSFTALTEGAGADARRDGTVQR